MSSKQNGKLNYVNFCWTWLLKYHLHPGITFTIRSSQEEEWIADPLLHYFNCLCAWWWWDCVEVEATRGDEPSATVHSNKTYCPVGQQSITSHNHRAWSKRRLRATVTIGYNNVSAILCSACDTQIVNVKTQFKPG